jgi:hypothetical protein
MTREDAGQSPGTVWPGRLPHIIRTEHTGRSVPDRRVEGTYSLSWLYDSVPVGPARRDGARCLTRRSVWTLMGVTFWANMLLRAAPRVSGCVGRRDTE